MILRSLISVRECSEIPAGGGGGWGWGKCVCGGGGQKSFVLPEGVGGGAKSFL